MSEQQVEQLMQQMQMLETYFSDLSQREGTFLSIFREAIAAIESIKSLGNQSDSDALVPLGMGAYIPTKISSNNKIVVNIGAGVAVEKDFPAAINYFEARIKEIEIALQDTAAKKHDAANRLEQGREQMNQLMQFQQSPELG
ncbi:MAG: prefoldin subunit alpha [Candidatus Nitrosopumilus limneticus]|nr:Prefoldin subunit alpha [Candidatus Nitrosopumilus limneticus]MDA0668677.1 prefoldin subunit alpha [Thermoproteota archaeon]HJJ20767.1 prefoldin subunit alpha [Nitrosopumilus sp.]MDA0853463.1 prefoldin subunit alpha [Thermoproteota archaeon]MDA1123584.1 prefoldin subunit alpha [Thermoproteota archaeon]